MRRPTVKDWPGLMRPETAARYCDMTPQEFAKAVGAGELPAPLMISGREYWRLVEIDECAAKVTGYAPDWRKELRHGRA